MNNRHRSKGHQNESGAIIDVGSYQSNFSFERYNATWIQNLRNHIKELQDKYVHRAESDRSMPEKDIALGIHKGAISSFYLSLGSARRFTHHGTCLCCLMGFPQYSLPCGHVICLQCVKLYGQDHEGGYLTFESCPLHPDDVISSIPWPICLKPESAGVRILSLDG